MRLFHRDGAAKSPCSRGFWGVICGNCFWVVFEIGADCIKTVIAFLLRDNSFIDIDVGSFCDFTLLRDMVC